MSDIHPTFSKSEATSFFSKIYHAEPRAFRQPSWMPSPTPPTAAFDESDISLDEIAYAVKKARSKSAPSPFDGMPYTIFKKCPSLLQALHNLFNLCWACSIVPSAWKLAAVRLIGKSTAEADPSTPSNFRPIALTPCVGKLFSTILRNRWLHYMLSNKYFDRSIQKAFMPATAGCTEHHMKLTTILKDAKKRKKSLAVCWMDLANAYGSVHHALITYSLRHYHAPSKLTGLIQAFYSGLAAKVSSGSWVTPATLIQLGVYQGDPLSVVIFNTVINTLVDTLKSKVDLGYRFSHSQQPINLLQYADDTCLIGNSPASCQHLVNTMNTWLQWSGMEAKLPKCTSLGLQATTGKAIHPNLSLDDQLIPYTPNGLKFLGLVIDVPTDMTTSKQTVMDRLHGMLKKVDACPLTRKQKLLVYKVGVCTRLTWLLTIQEFPISWVEKELDPLVSCFLKKWSGLARSANPAILHLPQKDGGLNLPTMSLLHKQFQVSRRGHLLTSHDPSVRHMSEKAMQKDLSLTRVKFRASREVRETMIADPSLSGRRLAKATSQLVREEEMANKLSNLQRLEKQGHMARCTPPDSAKVWAKALEGISDEHLKFALNSAVDTLPHKANLYLWKKHSNSACPLCGERQSLIHVLNACEVARDERRYNPRHDAILSHIAAFLSHKATPTAHLTSDLGSYVFPQHIVATDLRPDIVWWDDSLKKIRLIELTVCFESSFQHAAERKAIKYEEVAARARTSGYNGRVITLEVGSRGIIGEGGFSKLKAEFNLTTQELSNLLISISRTAIVESYKMWCRRNTHTLQQT